MAFEKQKEPAEKTKSSRKNQVKKNAAERIGMPLRFGRIVQGCQFGLVAKEHGAEGDSSVNEQFGACDIATNLIRKQ